MKKIILSLMKGKIKVLDHERATKVNLGSIISKRRLNTREVTLAYQKVSTLLPKSRQENQRRLDILMKENRIKEGTKAKLMSRKLLEMTAIVKDDKDNQLEDNDQWKQLNPRLNPSTDLDIAVAHELGKYAKIWLKTMAIVLDLMNLIMTGMAKEMPLEIVLPEVT